MTTPIWITPAGFLTTVTQLTNTSTQIVANGTDVSYSLISGILPNGLFLSTTGFIYGRPYAVGETTRRQFTIRASNRSGITDRTFTIDVAGHFGPIWITPPGTLGAGLFNSHIVLNGEIVDYQLQAEELKLQDGQQLRYFIADNDGQLPPGLTLDQYGRITGQVKDLLKIDYQASNYGGYDDETYDVYPYDHVTIVAGEFKSTARYIPKLYVFYITVTDGAITNRQKFSMLIEDPNDLRVDNTYIDVDTVNYTADADYLLSPQWLSPANLGIVRANNKQIIPLNVYDFNPFYGPTTYDWTTPTKNIDGSASVHPPFFKLDPNSGVLYGTLPYQPAFNLTYNFTVWVIKTDLQNNNQTTSARTFTLIIRGQYDNTVNFISTGTIGVVNPGQVSELSIQAQFTDLITPVEYKLISGSLPDGLTLLQDGTIAGQVSYNSYTSFDLNNSGYNSFKLDYGLTTIDRYKYFNVEAGNIYQNGSTTASFKIEISVLNTKKYTGVYAQPFLPLDQRQSFNNFVNNQYTFDPKIMYRPYDANFGIQQKIKMYLEFGLEQTNIDVYFTEALANYFTRKKFIFGSVEYKTAVTPSGDYIYDIVYINVVDTASNQAGKGPVGSIIINGQTVHPNNIFNMRKTLESILINGNQITTNEYLMPRFMRSLQLDGNQLGYIPVVPLCYTLPGNGAVVVEKIAQNTFDFKTIDFTIDRFIFDNNLTDPGAKYLMFPTKDDFGNNLGQSLSYINTSTDTTTVLRTETGQFIYLE